MERLKLDKAATLSFETTIYKEEKTSIDQVHEHRCSMSGAQVICRKLNMGSSVAGAAAGIGSRYCSRKTTLTPQRQSGLEARATLLEEIKDNMISKFSYMHE